LPRRRLGGTRQPPPRLLGPRVGFDPPHRGARFFIPKKPGRGFDLPSGGPGGNCSSNIIQIVGGGRALKPAVSPFLFRPSCRLAGGAFSIFLRSPFWKPRGQKTPKGGPAAPPIKPEMRRSLGPMSSHSEKPRGLFTAPGPGPFWGRLGSPRVAGNGNFRQPKQFGVISLGDGWGSRGTRLFHHLGPRCPAPRWPFRSFVYFFPARPHFKKRPCIFCKNQRGIFALLRNRRL